MTAIQLYFAILLVTIFFYILSVLFGRKYLKISDVFTELLCNQNSSETEIKMMSKELDKYRNITYAMLVLAFAFIFLSGLVKI